jgi:hypothetical protein
MTRRPVGGIILALCLGAAGVGLPARADVQQGGKGVTPPTPAEAAAGPRRWMWVAAGSAVAFLGAAGVVWNINSGHRQDAITAHCNGGQGDPTACMRFRNMIEGDNVITRWLLFGAVLSTMATAVLFTVEPAWSASPVGDHAGVLVTRTWRF